MRRSYMKKFRILCALLIIISTFSNILFTKDIVTAQASTIQLNSTSLTLELGHHQSLKVNGTTNNASWYSSNSKVATVSSKGNVTAYASGNTTITAIVAGKRLTCKVKVFQIYKKDFTLGAGQTYQYKVWGPYHSITWDTSDPSIATVSSSGVVTANTSGIATITANVDGFLLTSNVTVSDISNKSIVLELGGWSGYIKTLKVNNASSTVTWTSSNKAIATVSSSGKVTAKGVGSTIIIASVNGAKLTCNVKVLKMSTKDLILKTGDTKTLKIYGTTSKITWTSNYAAVATVSNDGTVTAVSTGTATITGFVDGRKVTSDVTVFQ